MKKRISLRSQAVVFYLLSLFPVVLTSLVLTVSSSRLFTLSEKVYATNRLYTELGNEIEFTQGLLYQYLCSGLEADLQLYRESFQITEELVGKIPQRALDSDYRFGRESLIALLNNYLQKSQRAAESNSLELLDVSFEIYQELVLIDKILQERMADLSLKELEGNMALASRFYQSFAFLQQISFGLLIVAALLSLTLLNATTKTISDPIIRLSEQAKKIADGKFDFADLSIEGIREIAELSLAHNIMKRNIQKYIEEIKEKGIVEQGLMEQKLANLEYKHLLKTAEIQTLQAQIDPHFLFNALNTGVQLALVEGAERTCSYMENLSDLYRYKSRRQLFCSLEEELQALDAYLYVVNIRFSDRFSFSRDVDDKALEWNVPAMIFQPLYENALKHGLSDRENDSRIRLKIGVQEDKLHITVSDNGIGMSKERLDMVRCFASNEDILHSLSGDDLPGQGLSNVFQRIRLCFENRASAEIDSIPGKGTEITLILPKGLTYGQHNTGNN